MLCSCCLEILNNFSLKSQHFHFALDTGNYVVCSVPQFIYILFLIFLTIALSLEGKYYFCPLNLHALGQLLCFNCGYLFFPRMLFLPFILLSQPQPYNYTNSVLLYNMYTLHIIVHNVYLLSVTFSSCSIPSFLSSSELCQQNVVYFSVITNLSFLNSVCTQLFCNYFTKFSICSLSISSLYKDNKLVLTYYVSTWKKGSTRCI